MLGCLLSCVFTRAHVLSPAALRSDTALFLGTDNGRGGRDERIEEAEWWGLLASCFPHCGLCGNTLVVMGASVSMQISVCLPSVCVCHVQSSTRVCFSVHLDLHSLEQKARGESM